MWWRTSEAVRLDRIQMLRPCGGFPPLSDGVLQHSPRGLVGTQLEITGEFDLTPEQLEVPFLSEDARGHLTASAKPLVNFAGIRLDWNGFYYALPTGYGRDTRQVKSSRKE